MPRPSRLPCSDPVVDDDLEAIRMPEMRPTSTLSSAPKPWVRPVATEAPGRRRPLSSTCCRHRIIMAAFPRC